MGWAFAVTRTAIPIIAMVKGREGFGRVCGRRKEPRVETWETMQGAEIHTFVYDKSSYGFEALIIQQYCGTLRRVTIQ